MGLIDKLIAIGDAIRGKKNTSNEMSLDEMAVTIENELVYGTSEEWILHLVDGTNIEKKVFTPSGIELWTVNSEGVIAEKEVAII